ncbi:GNAT family N-acetyltransferase [Acrocarpospora catenulata]|uniref:GNAT family N-acetyltransferase n=1 Tax=Acrocarpospora catenulata TaxID=2836182 RepID=UPI001BDAA6C5|nr:GNAT family protein [Acrocarpospora catenulata]
MFDEHLTIQTERLVLRAFGPGDAERVRAIVKEGTHSTALPPGAPGYLAGIAQWLSHGVHELRKSGQGMHLAIEAGGAIVGAISLFKTHWGAGTTEVGYGVHPSYRGRGFAPEAVRGLTDWALGPARLRRVELRATVENIASLRVAEKAGFTREGVLRGAGFEDDGPHDVVVFGRLRGDAGPGFDGFLQSERLLLRPFQKRDAFDVLAAVKDDAEMLRWMPWVPGYTLERALDWCTRVAHPGSLSGLTFALEPRDGGRLAGALGVHRVDRERGDAEIGYWISPWARRQGYAVEATRRVAGWLIAQGYIRVQLMIAVGNTASRAVARKAGFVEEGMIRQGLPIPHGRADAVLYSILREGL